MLSVSAWSSPEELLFKEKMTITRKEMAQKALWYIVKEKMHEDRCALRKKTRAGVQGHA